jgi:phosphoribosylglycinamide formyltransferase-1
MKKIIVLASGKGSNFEALLHYINEKSLPIQIEYVLTDKENAPVIEKAKSFGVPTKCIPFTDKESFHSKLNDFLHSKNPDLIVLAGFLRLLPNSIIEFFRNRIINIHPSLLPAFPGLKSIEKAFEYGVRYTGCTVHFVEEGVDTGAIIFQSIVEILPNTTVSELTEKIHLEEHKILPKAVEYFCLDRITVDGRKVVVREE